MFDHVMGLDLSFHLGRKTGEITKQIERGTNAMQVCAPRSWRQPYC